jgi:hypothetical protein
MLQVQFYKYNFTSFARSTTEQMPALVYDLDLFRLIRRKVDLDRKKNCSASLIRAAGRVA